MTMKCKKRPLSGLAGMQISLEVSADCKQTLLRPLNAEGEQTESEEVGEFERQVVEYAGFEAAATCMRSPIPESACNFHNGSDEVQKPKCIVRPMAAVGYAVHNPFMGQGWEWPPWLLHKDASYHHVRCNSWWRQQEKDLQAQIQATAGNGVV